MREKRVTSGENGICHFEGGICQGKKPSKQQITNTTQKVHNNV